mmetsp:Transcript_18167/g.52468  ORF Transcript_18167/g.52468 Transcript_18167/m.52468 type:complete len:213 (+) Transcript_18167:346-984(+)
MIRPRTRPTRPTPRWSRHEVRFRRSRRPPWRAAATACHCARTTFSSTGSSCCASGEATGTSCTPRCKVFTRTCVQARRSAASRHRTSARAPSSLSPSRSRRPPTSLCSSQARMPTASQSPRSARTSWNAGCAASSTRSAPTTCGRSSIASRTSSFTRRTSWNLSFASSSARPWRSHTTARRTPTWSSRCAPDTPSFRPSARGRRRRASRVCC